MNSIPTEAPDPAYAFAFEIQERFTYSAGGILVISAPDCEWSVPSGELKALLRTPEGKLLESAASYVHTTPNLQHIITLCLRDLSKDEVPVGTQLFVRMRRTADEQEAALTLLDKLMGENWTTIEEFSDLPDGRDFKVWITRQIELGKAKEVAIKKPHRKNQSGENWYLNCKTNQVWRFLLTLFPSKHSLECLGESTE